MGIPMLLSAMGLIFIPKRASGDSVAASLCHGLNGCKVATTFLPEVKCSLGRDVAELC